MDILPPSLHARLLNACASLNDATDEMSTLFDEYQATLADCKPGVPAWVWVSSNVLFGYDKINGQWMLATDDGTGPNHNPRPLKESPREYRALCVGNFDKLVEELIRQCDLTSEDFRKKLARK